MINRKALILLSFLLTIFIVSGGKTASITSSIKGKVVDAKTGASLPGANIWIVGTSMGTASDIHGEYLISKVPPGTYQLRVTFIGYKTKEVTVKVLPNKPVNLDFKLENVAIKGEVVTITAQAEGQTAAINQQLTSEAIVNVVSSARIQEVPDDNAAESVGRLPGVSVLRSGGEGNKVVIRGLAPKFNTVKVAGVKMASTDYNDRSVDLSMISPYMLEGIEVIKAITPDMDADALGGSVNFKLREAREGLSYDVLFQGGYNNLKKTYDDYKIVANVGNRFFKNKLGIFAQIDAEKRNRSANSMGAEYELISPELDKENEPLINGLNLNDITRYKERYGGTLVLDYKLPSGSIVFNNFYSFSDTKAQSRSQSYGIALSTHDYTTNDSERKLKVMVNSLNYGQNLSFFNIDAKLTHSLSEQESPKNLSFNFVETNALQNFDRTLPPTELPNYAVNDLQNTVLADIFQYDEYAKDRELTASVDISRNFNLSRKVSTKIKLGGKYGYKDREYDYNAAGGFLNYGSGQGARDAILDAFPWMKEMVPSGSLNLLFPLFIDPNYHPDEFLKGQYEPWPAADIDLMYDVVDVLKNFGDSEAYRHMDMSSTLYDYSGNEYYKAGYFMSDMKYGNKIRLIAGVRYEEVTREYSAVQGNSTIGKPQTNYVHVDTTTKVTNTNWLPMVHLKIKPVEWFDIRFAYTNTLSRPDYIRIIPRLNIGRETVSWKNYRLKPSHSENYDLYLSFHENTLGLFTVGGFKKRIEDMIFAISGRVILNPEEYGLDANQKGKKLYTDENNQYAVDFWGIELNWQTHFWYLPGILKGLVLDANYTHIFSEAKYPRSIVYSEFIMEPPWIVQTVVDTFYTARMLYQPDDIANISFGFDYKGFSGRVSLLYQSNIFSGANFWPELRQVTDDYWRWDMSIKQKLPWHGWQLFLNVRNLTRTIDRYLNVGSGYPSSEQFYGRGIDLGLRYRMK